MTTTTTPRPPRRKPLASLRLVREVIPGAYATIPGDGVPCRSPKDVAAYMQQYATVELSETFWVLMLDAQHRLIGGAPVVVTRGILNSSLVHAREVFRAAIMKNAAAIILAHNHPSGDPTPSADDRMVTAHLVGAGRTLDIPVHDHVILGGQNGRYSSFAEMGLL